MDPQFAKASAMFVDSNPKTAVVPLTLAGETSQKALGVLRDNIGDEFIITFQSGNKPNTRRNILSNVFYLFGPLRLVAPLCLFAKQLLQKWYRYGSG